MASYGGQSNIGEIKGVLVKRPQEAYIDQAHVKAQWQDLNYLGETDFNLAVEQHARMVSLLGEFGAEVVYLPEAPNTGLDSVYVHDPVIVCNKGAILCHMGKLQRRGESEAAGKFLSEMGIPILGRIEGEGTLEGGDLIWLDERTVAVGESYRTNAEGIRQLRAILGDLVDEVIAVPLPHWTGPADCLHLMSNISPLDKDLALVYSRLLPVPFRQMLERRGIKLVEVPDNEYDSMGCNVLAIAPRKAIAVAGNSVTQERMEAAGVEVWTFEGSDISVKGSGGPTCLTRPFWRG
jgi:N-dimethylarginine dimethylaminohydrolase